MDQKIMDTSTFIHIILSLSRTGWMVLNVLSGGGDVAQMRGGLLLQIYHTIRAYL